MQFKKFVTKILRFFNGTRVHEASPITSTPTQSKQNSLKTPSRMTHKPKGRPHSGSFFTNGGDTRRFWSVAKVSIDDAELITALAAQNNEPVTDFSGKLIYTFLSETNPALDTNEEVFVRGKQFGGQRQSKINRWLAIGISQGVLDSCRMFQQNSPKYHKLTDYQLMSEILHLALHHYAKNESMPE